MELNNIDKDLKIEGELPFNKMSSFDLRYIKFKQDLAESKRSIQETIDRCGNTLEGLKTAITGIEDVNQQINDMKAAWSDVFSNALSNFSAGMPMVTSTHNQGGTPIPATAEIVAEKVAGCKKIMILTGAGISAASGIPTFRGAGGLWTTRNNTKTLKATDFLTHSCFLDNPEEIWRWHHEFKRLVDKCKYNSAHQQIAEFQLFCLQSGIPFMLVTQNIDDFHVHAFENATKSNPTFAKTVPQDWKDPESIKFGYHPHIVALHGSVNYIRHHIHNQSLDFRLFPYPKTFTDTTLPLINTMKSRPHTLLFDEAYDDTYYRSESVKQFNSECDCLIVVGTALETNLASQLVGKAINNKALVVEINPNPCIQADGVYQLKGRSEEFLPNLFKLAKEELMKKYPPSVLQGKESTLQTTQPKVSSISSPKSSTSKAAISTRSSTNIEGKVSTLPQKNQSTLISKAKLGNSTVNKLQSVASLSNIGSTTAKPPVKGGLPLSKPKNLPAKTIVKPGSKSTPNKIIKK